MANWKYRLNVSDVFHNDEKTLDEKAKRITYIVKNSGWFEKLYYTDDLAEILEELVDAGEADDVEWFDACWSAAYDIFDAEKVWVITR